MVDRSDVITLRVDLGPFRAAMRTMAAAVNHIGQMVRVVATVRERANDPVRVAGLEARYFVRGGLDPAHATREEVRRAVTALLAGQGDAALLSTTNRRRVAAALIRGQRTWRHR